MSAHPEGPYGDPVVTKHEDGSLTWSWPSPDTRWCAVSRELMDQWLTDLSAHGVITHVELTDGPADDAWIARAVHPQQRPQPYYDGGRLTDGGAS